MNMEYQEFLQSIKDSVKKQVQVGCEVKLNSVIKNNDQKLDAITIIGEDIRIAPNIYLNGYYEDFLKGRELVSIVQDIVTVSNSNNSQEANLFHDLLDFDSISHQITYRLINLNMNRERLKDLPYQVIEDITARSIINQERDMDNLYRKQLIYSYGIALIVLLLASINIVNNLKYRICIRKKEISIYRAIGIKYNMICKMIRLENMILGVISGVITCLASVPITVYLYKRSQLSYLQVNYHNDNKILVAVCILILIICNIVSRVITRELRGSSIVENINGVE